MTNQRSDHQLAADLAREAGELLVRIRADFAEDGDGKALKAAGDLGSHNFLMAALAAAPPGDAVLSEEGADDKARLTADRVWIGDPPGRHPRVLRAPAGGLGGARGPVAGGSAGRRRGGAPRARGGALHRCAARDPRAVWRSHPPGGQPLEAPAWLPELVEALEAELAPMGSAGVKATSVLDGTADAYVHAGGQYEPGSAEVMCVFSGS